KLATIFDGEVISADSRQVYRGLDIGTGKITEEEMRGIPHHLLDVADANEQFSAAEFVKLGRTAIADINNRGKLPIIAGGTGFYISALLGEIKLPDVPPNKALRVKLEKMTNEELFTLLKERDLQYTGVIDPNNRPRLIRTLEIVETLGKMPHPQSTPHYDTLKIGIDVSDDVLKKKIQKRLKERMEYGMRKEAESLYQEGLSYERMDSLGLEYRYLAKLLKGELSQEEFETELATKTWQYAKRQKTWFKRDKEILWISTFEEIKKEAERFLA
ncbi:MAG: tRNA (adenosine(37)-N6)-dimethylallyltransferase MiaA, partial [Candidatus Paceibacterota bacterium]